jgi:hypothetical protein
MKVRVLQLNLVVDMLGDAVSAGVVFNPGFAAAGCHRCIRKKQTSKRIQKESVPFHP